MPTYQYECDACGPFASMRPLALFEAPCPCPGCGADASRTALSAPAILKPGSRMVCAEPQPSSAPAHPAGCGCCARRMPLPNALAAGGRVFASQGPIRRSGL